MPDAVVEPCRLVRRAPFRITGPRHGTTVTACPECQALLEDDANFCHACGADVRAVTRAVAAPPADDAETSVMAAVDPDPTSGMVAVHGDEDPTDPGPTPPVPADATQVVALVGTVACPNCGANNSSRRSLCGRCGADMKTGEVAARPAPPPAVPTTPAEPRASERDRVTRTRTTALIVVAGLLLGALVAVGAACFAGDLCGRGDAELPPVTFEPTLYTGDTTGLPLTQVATRTIKPAQGGDSFGPERMFDGDLTTAWHNSGATNPDGEGEVIRVELQRPAWITEVVLGNGDQADSLSFSNNARLHRVTARADGGVVVGLVFLNAEGQQAVAFPEPVLTTALRLEVDETFAGATFDDLAVAELSIRGHVATGDDEVRALERARLAPTAGN